MAITTWTSITAGDDSAEAPFRTRFANALRSRLMHVQEFVYDRSVHTPHRDRPHDHCGVCSLRLPSSAVPNLILGGLCTTGWIVSGASQSTSTGTRFSATGQSARKPILNGTSSATIAVPSTKQVFGAGCPVVVALLLRKVGVITAATVNFGLADGGSFATGAKGTVTQANLTTSFQRFYFYLTSFSASSHATDTSFLITTSGTFSGGGSVDATLALFRPGNGLSYWMPGHMEDVHRILRNTQAGPASLYDKARDFTNALQVTPS